MDLNRRIVLILGSSHRWEIVEQVGFRGHPRCAFQSEGPSTLATTEWGRNDDDGRIVRSACRSRTIISLNYTWRFGVLQWASLSSPAKYRSTMFACGNQGGESRDRI